MLEGLAWEQFRVAGHPERFRDKIGVLVPAYNEADSIGEVLDRIPAEVCGVETAVLVVDDGSRDGTGEVAARARRGRRPPRDQPRRRRRAAHRLPAAGRLRARRSSSRSTPTASTCPRRWSAWCEPVLDGEVAVAHGSRVLGEAEPNHPARELGIVFFNRMVSFITRTKVSDCSNGYRAVRADVLPAARPAPGAVPHLRVPDRGDQARRSRPRRCR